MLVDAGYLLSAGGSLRTGVTIRAALKCNHRDLVQALIKYATDHCGQDLLRVYWYDGAKDAVPTAEHKLIGGLDNVKVRLGRLTRSGQKGVDSRIVRDLITLGRERAVTTAFVLSGDEDLREGVADAQEVGVRVLLVGIKSRKQKSNQSQSLIREADEHLFLPESVLEHISLRDDLITVDLAEDYVETNGPKAAAEQVGQLFAEEWAHRTTPEEVYSLAEGGLRLPKDLDVDLLAAAAIALSRDISKDLRNSLRDGFRKELLAAVALFDAAAADEGD
ncbi:MAG: NYN domain-containing protein [Acidobacteria bacterium]|nr:NYN domain-containing protein [Acidobacteriota bacterium]